MTKFNVHIYREMRVTFEGIEAETPQAAASIAAEKPTGDADDIEDCDGEDLAALVDVVGDEEFSQSVTIDFEAVLHRNAASKLLAALESLAEQADEDCPVEYRSRHFIDAMKDACDVIAQSKAAAISPAPGDIDIHAELAKRRQIADIWSIEDVQEVRPDLTADQAWDVLQVASRNHDATIGIDWDVLSWHAEMLYGSAPDTDEAEEA